MTENDLKIGNLVKLYRFPEDKEMSIFSVKSIYLEENNKPCYFVELNDGFCVNVSALKGVELSDDLLNTYGFEKRPNPNNTPSFIFSKKRFYGFDILKSVFPEERWKFFEPRVHSRDNIYFFHEVQNMFYEVHQQKLSLL